jgi:hypothetical protein
MESMSDSLGIGRLPKPAICWTSGNGHLSLPRGVARAVRAAGLIAVAEQAAVAALWPPLCMSAFLGFKRVQLKRQHGFSCCHLQVYRLIRQDLTALSLLQTFANVPFKPIGKLLPIAV